MKKILMVPAFSLLLGGCTWTSAFETAPHQYTISSHGSIFNSREELLMKINRKAGKVCAGPYRLEGDQGANMITSTRTHIGNTPSSVLSLTAYCEEPAQ